jgi:hypothetical protein
MQCSICGTGRRRAAGYNQWLCFQPGALRETKREGRKVAGIAVLDDCGTVVEGGDGAKSNDMKKCGSYSCSCSVGFMIHSYL